MIEVLRLGHRIKRDERLTTHICLVARAFGADKTSVSEEDRGLEETIGSVISRFGGELEVETGVNWKRRIRDFKGIKVHLTMYGLPLGEVVPDLGDGDNDLLVIVGSEKVPGEVYRMVDHNVAVGNQPHSEAAALAIFLDRVTGGEWEEMSFDGGEMEIVPTAHGKSVRRKQ